MNTDKLGNRYWRNQNGQRHREDGPAIEWANGTKEWYLNGQLHREDGPAIEYADGTKSWYRNGLLHREDGPAYEGASGTKIWYRNGQCHRSDGPAVEYADGTKEWWLNDRLHRKDGPAIEWANGTKEWWLNGQLHREDGPAYEGADGTKEWWLNGERMAEEEFIRKIHFVSYVAGLCFDNSKKIVALVKKNRPAWQKGKLNAIGGKIEKDETPIEAIRREFLEETGVEIQSWEETCTLTGKDWEVHFFHTFNDAVFNVRVMTDEAILLTEIEDLDYSMLIPNLRVIVPLALDETGILKPVRFIDRS